jgi:hypothetical protein
VILDARTFAITPDPYGLLEFDRLRAAVTDAERADRRTPTLLFLRVGSKRSLQPLLMAPNAVRDLDSATRRVSTMQHNKQSTKLGHIHTRMVRRFRHRRQPNLFTLTAQTV